MSVADGQSVKDSVKDYYGKQLQTASDLKVPGCLTPGKKVPKHIRDALALVHDKVKEKYYGCGLVIPEKLEGMNVLDLGSGSGQDCFVLSKLVGKDGHVTGVDMTDEQLAVAREYIDYHTQKFGYPEANVNYVQGYIEKLTEAGIKEDSIDIIISNCVVNLSPDKKAVLSESYKVLKVGGELHFSDIYADSSVSETARKHEVLWGECIAGALFWEDLFSLAKEIGFSQPLMVSAREIAIDREDFKKVLGDVKFASITYRLFKLPEKQENAKQVIYNGEVTGNEDGIQFDHKNLFKKGTACDVDSQLATILTVSRFAEEFDFQPVSKKCCNGSTVEEKVVDPFAYIVKQAESGAAPAAGCCGGKSKCC